MQSALHCVQYMEQRFIAHADRQPRAAGEDRETEKSVLPDFRVRRFLLRTPTPEAILVARLDEIREQRVRLERLRLEFGMKLASEEKRMPRNLNDFDVGPVRRGSGDVQPRAREQRLVFNS